jgi:RNA polymerase sigma-70 factor (ECF subfamily)
LLPGNPAERGASSPTCFVPGCSASPARRCRDIAAGAAADPQTPAPGDRALDEHVRFLIACLSETDQEIVRLVYWDGFTQQEVATILGKPATAIRARLSRARKVLRDQLAESGDVE